MIETGNCYLCNKNCQITHLGGGKSFFECDRCGKYYVTGRVLAAEDAGINAKKYLLSSITRWETEMKNKPIEITSLAINELIVKASIPNKLSEKIDRVLMYLRNRSKAFGELVDISIVLDYPLGFCSGYAEFDKLLDAMEEKGFIRRHTESGELLELTTIGWENTEKTVNVVDKIIDETRKEEVFRYDVVLSFAGEDRDFVHKVAACLAKNNIRYFYDIEEKVDLWGKELTEYLPDIYKNRGQYCVMFISRHYLEKMWTRLERRSILERALREEREYILPVRFDKTEIPGLRDTIFYLDLNGVTPDELCKMIVKKIKGGQE